MTAFYHPRERQKTVATALLAALILGGFALQPGRLIPAPLSQQAWRFSAGRLQEAVPKPTRSLPVETIALPAGDLDGDGRLESLRLENGQLGISSMTAVVWRNPRDWEVSQAGIADLNRDRQPEAILLVWRPFRPWPIDRYLPNPGRIAGFHDSAGRSCHLILIGWKAGGYRELWAGSALVDPLRAFSAADLDGDGWQELAVLEAAYDEPPGAPANALSVWEWNGFGFTLLDRVSGRFRKVSTAPLNSEVLILTES